MNTPFQEKQNLISQWAFDTRPVLGRFHLWLEDVEVQWSRGEPAKEFTTEISFLNGQMERLMAITGAVTALGTQLFGRFGAGADQDKAGLNQAKKDADAISAYAMSESLWYLTRQLPENHAIMVCMGEGLMPKAGETPEMGSNPLLGFGRVYARPEVARWLDRRVLRLLNEPGYEWDEFYADLKESGITVWGAAIDTLENTSRFSKGKDTGPMTVLHLFDQPLHISRPYEGYMGNLFLPGKVVAHAVRKSILINFRTPRELVLESVEATFPGIRRDHIHVWTLRGKSREKRLGTLWRKWQELGVHLVDDGWVMPSGMKAFTESGTYAPSYLVGSWEDSSGDCHVFLVDGYAASAEALQAASLAPMLDMSASLCVFTSSFKLPYEKEQEVMMLNPDAPDFKQSLEQLCEASLDDETVNGYREMIKESYRAGIPMSHHCFQAEDFFPEKKWHALAVCGFMRPDPYSGLPGVEKVSDDVYRVSVRLSSRAGDKVITFTLRLMETLAQSQLIFNPLLNRFLAGEQYDKRPVKISDSGRIRNELQTLCSEALEFIGEERIRIYLDRISTDVIPMDKQKKLMKILQWYKVHHPLWFNWLEIIDSPQA